MLVLSRKVHESIWIGDDVLITVLSVSRGRVKIGIDASPELHIERSELRQALLPNEA